MRSFVCNCAFLILPAFGWTQTIVHLGTSQITASAIGLSDTHPAISGDSLGAGISFNLSIAASSTTTPALTLSQHPDGIGVAGGSYYEIDNRNNLDPGDDETMTFSLSQVAGLAEGQSLCITAIGIRSIASDTKQYSLTDASGTRAGTFNSSPFVIDVSNQASVSLSAVGPNSGAVVYSRFIVNQLHLQVVYLTDGRSRTVQVGKRQIQLRQTTPKNMATAGKISGTVIQALKHLGKDQVDDDVVAKLDARLDTAARKQLMKDTRSAPAWIADIFRKLAQTTEVSA